MNAIEWIGLVAATAMPFWNIPLILRIWQRKSSEDISLAWVFGVWVCVVGMLPAALASSDATLKIFGIVNAFLFTCVFIVVLKFHPSIGNRRP